MGHGTGVTAKRMDDGRWIVRWRERVEDGDGWRWASRQKIVSDETRAQRLADKIRRAKELGELPDLEPVRREPEVASVDAVLAGYARAQSKRGRAKSTLVAITTDTTRVLEALRTITRTPADRAIPGTALVRDNVFEVTGRLQERGFAEATVYRAVRMLVAAWTWACDDAPTYPGLAPAPRDRAAVYPKAPEYVETEAPRMDEVDAMISELVAVGSTVSLPIVTIARCTGLRSGQILAMTVADVSLAKRTITIRTGKTRQERIGRRTVPYAGVLHETLVGLCAGRPAEATLIKRRTATTGRWDPGNVRDAWERATVAGKVRRETWEPPDREIGRPDHALRACFQSHLVRAGVRDEVIDLLVGHAGGLRAKHYVGPEARWEAMVEAVAHIPEITLTTADEEPAADNVVQYSNR